MARRRRPSLAQKAPLYPRDGASRLMFGTPAARHPYLLTIFLSFTAKSIMRGLGRGRSPRCPKIPARCALTEAALPLKWVVSAKQPYRFYSGATPAR